VQRRAEGHLKCLSPCVLGSGAYGFQRINQIDDAQKAAPHLKVGLAQPNVGEIELHTDPDASNRALRDETALREPRAPRGVGVASGHAGGGATGTTSARLERGTFLLRDPVCVAQRAAPLGPSRATILAARASRKRSRGALRNSQLAR
jgi:hypothetical protein